MQTMRKRFVFALAPRAGEVTIAQMLLTRRHMFALGTAFATHPVWASDAPVVFAASSLKGALDQIAASFHPMRLSYAGSGVLARQILQGAPADVYLSANDQWMDVVEDAGILIDGQRQNLLGNRLVLIGPPDAAAVGMADWRPDGRIAMGFVRAVPAGQYGKAAFEALGLWHQIRPHVVEVENVRAALALVQRGELPYAVVYASDAYGQDDVKILHTFPAELHPQITYPLGVLTNEGSATLDALSGPQAGSVFQAAGFEVF